MNISETQAQYWDTDSATAQTVAEMCRHIRESVRDPEVRYIARHLLTGLETGSRRELADAVWAWCKNNIRFVQDEEQLQRLLGRGDELELLISPAVIARSVAETGDAAGDCDDFTMMACALLSTLSVPTFIKTFKCSASEPWRWSHVCAVAVLENGDVYPVDASHGDYPGWQVPPRDTFGSQLWDMNGNKVAGEQMRKKGLGSYRPQPSWTGNPMTTVDGPQAGPYPGGDSMRYWYPGPDRLKGLQGIARGGFGGMGDVFVGPDGLPFEFTPDVGGITPSLTLATSFDPSPSGSSGPGFNWGNFFGNLLGSGTRLASQAIGTGAQLLPNGNVLLPNGQVIAGSPQSAGISSSVLLIGALLIGGVMLVSAAKK